MAKTAAEKTRVKSIRFDEGTYRCVKAYVASRGASDSAAIRERVAKGLAADGLSSYSTELECFLRERTRQAGLRSPHLAPLIPHRPSGT